LVPATSSAADTAFHAAGNFNPLVPGYFADPTIKKFGDIYHMYATTDGNGGGRGPATVWVSRDFVDWVLVPMNWPTTPFYWAPDVIQRPDGRYYLYYSQPCNVFAGVADKPAGPWTPLTSGDGLIIPDRLMKDVITLDAQFFEDRDDTLYAYWGTWGIFSNSGCAWGVLNPDMKSFSRMGMIPNTQAKDFFEAPEMIERNGVYYFTYSSGSCHDSSYRVQYAVGDRPDGDFKMGPNNPILSTNADGTIDGPGHHSFLREGDEWFIIYHRHDIPVTPNGLHRQLCADRMVFGEDGVIHKIEPTHRGIGARAARTKPANLARGSTVRASSHYRDTLRNHEYLPEFAVDDNNATLWRPADNRAGHWLTVDMGTPQRVRRIETQFEYATWFYQYLIETSLDGTTWATFADRRSNTRWGSPMVDEGDLRARYLRLTVTGTEYPGLAGAVWNFKAFSEAPADPLLAQADEAFAKFIAPRQTQAGVHAGPAETPTVARPPTRLIDLDAAAVELGTAVAAWSNKGTLGGEFRASEVKPRVAMAAGCKALRFSGRELLTATFGTPRALAGNSSFTVAAWVNNPEIGESECYLSWAGRGGPDATTSQFGYGSHSEFGAVGHWGFADMGFGGKLPEAGKWHHLAVVFDGVIERLYVNGRLANAEAKMLLMHAGRAVIVGASEPGSEHFDGFLASLQVYDGALDESAVKELAAQAPAAEVLIHVDAAKLDYGPLEAWPNQGALGGSFAATGKAPVVADVDGRLAVSFAPGSSLELAVGDGVDLAEFTALLDLANPALEAGESVLGFVAADGTLHAVAPLPSASSWQQVAVVCSGGKCEVFVNGTRTAAGVPAPPGRIKALRLGGELPFHGSLARVQLFRRALNPAEVARLHSLWQAERVAVPAATFDHAPAALSPTLVGMRAAAVRSDHGPVEYRFTETSGHPGGCDAAWSKRPFFLDDELARDTRYRYTVKVRDPLGNVGPASAPAEVLTSSIAVKVFTDEFGAPRDILASGVAGTLWDGFLGPAEDSAPAAIASGDGQLRLESKGTVWDGGKPRGVLLFKQVAGDFVAETEIADYAGLANRQVPGNNDGGLMARVADPDAAGPGEDFVQVGFFPIWNQGNILTNFDGGRSQKGNMLGWNAHRHLQLIRHGNLLHCRTSPDGRQWTDLPGSPVERPDLDGLPLQVGIYHASYGGESSHVSFRRFQLSVRE
jgi:hypothetical protein